MTKLNQIIAVEKGVKQNAHQRVTEAYQTLQKGALLQGISRTYRSKDDEGDQLPAESTLLQVRVESVVDSVCDELERLWDVVATKEIGNTEAKADVVVDGTVLLSQVPVTYLLFLEKQLIDINTFAAKLPVLDPAEKWELSEEHDCYVTPGVETHRTKKVPRVLEKAPATDKHAAQVEVWHEDVVVGYWNTVKFSGALPASEVRELQERVSKVREAVKVAREEANAREVTNQKLASAALAYIFG